MEAGKICVIAIAANTFCCMLHTISRRWGIILNNVLGGIKFLILIQIIIFGIIWANKDVAASNLASFSTENSPKLPYRYAEALVFAAFPFGGFHQCNYVRIQRCTASRTAA